MGPRDIDTELYGINIERYNDESKREIQAQNFVVFCCICSAIYWSHMAKTLYVWSELARESNRQDKCTNKAVNLKPHCLDIYSALYLLHRALRMQHTRAIPFACVNTIMFAQSLLKACLSSLANKKSNKFIQYREYAKQNTNSELSLFVNYRIKGRPWKT